jgi:hypothetical protein
MPPPKLPTKEDDVWKNAAILVDKPLKWTSSDVVCKLRGALDVKKIGHGVLTAEVLELSVLAANRRTASYLQLCSAVISSVHLDICRDLSCRFTRPTT